MLVCDFADGLLIMDGENKTNGFPRWVHNLALGRKPKWTIVRIAVLVLTIIILYEFVIIPIRVQGISMEPTYHDGSINLINRLAYRHATPRRGDVVGVRLTAGEHILYMKRVVALPGETISFHEGILYINDQPMLEPYLKYNCYCWEMPPVHLGANWYYVVGDNRSMSWKDHYQFKADLITEIVGKVIFGGKS